MQDFVHQQYVPYPASEANHEGFDIQYGLMTLDCGKSGNCICYLGNASRI